MVKKIVAIYNLTLESKMFFFKPKVLFCPTTKEKEKVSKAVSTQGEL
jgi:hypothetical protein